MASESSLRIFSAAKAELDSNCNSPVVDTKERQAKVQEYVKKKKLLCDLALLVDSTYQASSKGIFKRKWTGFGSKLLHSLKKSFGLDSDNAEFDFASFSDVKDFAKCCEVVSGQLEKVNKMFGEQLIRSENLKQTLSQLLEKKILLSFLGPYNVGKSTLINAILGDAFLPVDRKAETGFTLTIQSSNGMNSAMVAACEFEGMQVPDEGKGSYLVVGKDIIAFGASNICQELKKMNNNVRKSEDKSKLPLCMLKVKLPLFLQVPEGWRLSLADNPGLDESIKCVTDEAMKSLKFSSAFCYVTTFGQYQQRETADLIRKLHKANKDIFRQKRLIIVVTKLDDVCTSGADDYDDEERLDANDVAEEVHKFICETCDCSDIPKEVVVPIYGKWAHTARSLARDPTCLKKKQQVTKLLEPFSSSELAGQGEGLHSCLHVKSVDELIKELERHSNIVKLEESLQKVATACMDVWRQKMKDDYLQYLRNCKKKLCDEVDTVTKDLEAAEKSISSRYQIMEDIYTMLGDIIVEIRTPYPSELPKCRELQQSYCKDIEVSDPKSSTELRIRLLVNDFKNKIASKVRDGNYGDQDFRQDLKSLVQSASNAFEQTLNSGFTELLSTRNRHFRQIAMGMASITTLMETQSHMMETHSHTVETHGHTSLKYREMCTKESSERIAVFESQAFPESFSSIEAPNVSRSLLERIQFFCREALESVKTFFTLDSESDYLKEDFTSSGLPYAWPSEDVCPSDSEAKSSSPQPSKEQETTSLEQTCKSPTSSYKDEDKPQLSCSNDSTDSLQESCTKARQEVSTYTKSWVPALNKAVKQLQESIEKEIQSHFANFEELVVQAYWKSYCKFAKDHLEKFKTVFHVQLDDQITLLKADIDQLLQNIDIRQLLLYHANVFSSIYSYINLF